MLLAITNDLMAVAPIERAALQLGLDFRAVGLAAVANLEDAQSLQLAVIDLNALDQVANDVASIRATIGPLVPLVAFGPHVHAEKLQAARDAGCTQVVTRGQFHQRAQEVIVNALESAG